MQCINDSVVYAIETTSAEVIQTIKCTDGGHYLLETRNAFTTSPCASLIFTKCPSEDQIKCIRISNGVQIGQFRIPISLTTRKYSVTSLSFHPSKNLIACSIFGDMISSSLFLFCSEADNVKREHDRFSRCEDDFKHDFNALEEWPKIQSKKSTTSGGSSSVAFDSILNRIDDLFFMAIRSPKHTEDTDQFREMKLFLQKFQQESPQIVSERANEQIRQSQNETELERPDRRNEFSSVSVGSKIEQMKNNELLEKRDGRNSWQFRGTTNASAKSDDSHSNASHNTFRVDLQSKRDTHLKKSDGNDLSNATYSVGSDISNVTNLTFEIQTTNHMLRSA